MNKRKKPVEKNKLTSRSVRSEEVQSIIDRMPTYWVKWIVLCVSIFMGSIMLLSFIVKYPDTIDGQISITGTEAPVCLVANSAGRIILLKSNKQQVKKGEIISYIESGAICEHILFLDSLLDTLALSRALFHSLPDTLLLGDISSTYNAFCLSYLQYERLLTSDIYTTMRQNLKQQIVSDQAVIVNLNYEFQLKERVIQNSKNRLNKDSVLLSIKGISEHDYQQQYAAHLSLQESQLKLESSRLMTQSGVSKNKIEIQRIILEEIENKEKAHSEFITTRAELFSALNSWKERYLQRSPIDGELEYFGFWRNNSFIQSGQDLFSIIPDKNDIMGEVMIPSYGAGKVKLGQTANVKINNYPYDEYGLLKGRVKSISRITNKMQTADTQNDAYLVIISFPDGTTTNFGDSLPIDFETKGTVEIITKPKRLINRLFDNLKSKLEK